MKNHNSSDLTISSYTPEIIDNTASMESLDSEVVMRGSNVRKG